jgi:hypothetical protein
VPGRIAVPERAGGEPTYAPQQEVIAVNLQCLVGGVGQAEEEDRGLDDESVVGGLYQRDVRAWVPSSGKDEPSQDLEERPNHVRHLPRHVPTKPATHARPPHNGYSHERLVSPPGTSQTTLGFADRPVLRVALDRRSATRRTAATNRAQTTAVEDVIRDAWYWLTNTPVRAQSTATPYAR